MTNRSYNLIHKLWRKNKDNKWSFKCKKTKKSNKIKNNSFRRIQKNSINTKILSTNKPIKKSKKIEKIKKRLLLTGM